MKLAWRKHVQRENRTACRRAACPGSSHSITTHASDWCSVSPFHSRVTNVPCHTLRKLAVSLGPSGVYLPCFFVAFKAARSTFWDMEALNLSVYGMYLRDFLKMYLEPGSALQLASSDFDVSVCGVCAYPWLVLTKGHTVITPSYSLVLCCRSFLSTWVLALACFLFIYLLWGGGCLFLRQSFTVVALAVLELPL